MPNFIFKSYAEEKVKTAKGGYQKLTVNYTTNKGEDKSKNVMSFANPAVYDAVKKLEAGQEFIVEYVPGDEYYNWQSVKTLDTSPAKQHTKDAPARVSTYETPEERARKQVYIIKQSSLAQAIASYGGDPVNDDNVDHVLQRAQRFTDWVMAEPDLFKDVPNDL